MHNVRLITAFEDYRAASRQVRASGGATDERSPYPPLFEKPASNGGETERPGNFQTNALTGGGGHFGSGEAVMPGRGKAIERAYTAKERDTLMDARPVSTYAECGALSGLSGASPPLDALGNARPASTNAAPDPAATMAVLGETTYDIYLNDRAYWQNVPANVWQYKLGGYQVLKKWLSYREQPVLGRPLKPEEVQHFTHTARRIGAILELTCSA